MTTIFSTARFSLAVLLCVLIASTLAFAAPCALNPTDPSVTICTPTPNATVTSPVNIVAGSTDSAGAIAMAIYVDNTLVRKVNGGEISATATLAPGKHYVVAQLWDKAGRIIKQPEYITVSTAPAPPTISFSANPSSISSGQSSTLTWSTSNASSVSIDNGVGTQPTSGSVSVSPTATTTYTLTATGPGGTATARATVNVSSGTSAPTISFSASPGSISAGQSSTLTWSTTNATSVSIDNGIGSKPTAGGVSVSPSTTTTYTLTATGPGGSASSQATVTVTNSSGCAPAKPAPSVTICSPANGTTVPSPVHVLAAAASTNGVVAMAVYFDNVLKYKANVNKVDTLIDASQGGHYVVVQFWDNSGRVPAKASANITVGGSGNPAPTVTFTASPTTITSGNSSTLTWNTTNSSSVSIDHGIGTVSASGAITVTPASTTTYTITATGAGGTTTAQTTVTVTGSTPSPTAAFTANPTTISAGQSSTLTWSTTNATSVSIDNGIGAQPTSGNVSVHPSVTTTYTLTATGPGGSKSVQATVNVSSSGGTCNANAAPSVNICSPTNGSTVASPVHVVATPASSTGVIAMAVYFDNVLKYKANVSKVDTLIDTTVGAHYVVVQFWDSGGRVPAKASVSVTVSNEPPPPPSELTVSPAIGTVYFSSTEQFTARDSNGNVDVNWFVDDVQGGNSSAGTIDTNGVYTAPANAGAHTIKAVKKADSSVTTMAVVNVVDPNLAMTTYHNDGQRTGANTSEAILKPSNLNRFGKIVSYAVDGQVYAQPLYVPDLTINGSAHNALFVATQHDSVYAFDADGKTSTPLWQKSLLGPGQSPVSSSDALGIKPEIGITSTPVIDRNTNTMYVVTYVATSGGNQFWLHALDVFSGGEKFGGPKQVTATVDGTGSDSSNGKITLSAGCYQRAGLAQGNGQIYIGFGHCHHGWLLAYDQNSLSLTAAFNTTPDGTGGTIWASGGAPAFDNSGNVYVMTGTNFGSTADSGYNNAFMKFSPSLSLLDYFIPSNNATLVANDVDLGAGAPMVLPDNESSHPHEIVGAGKDGRIFLIDRDSMGHFDPNTDHVIQSIQSGAGQWNNFHDTPAYWNGNLYYHGNADVLRQFKWTNGLLSTSPVATGGVVFNAHGATPVVSANGTADGIVWELKNDGQPSSPTILYAYDANNVAHQLYNSANNANDTGPNAVKFTVPTVVNGKVFVGGGGQVAIYGLVR